MTAIKKIVKAGMIFAILAGILFFVISNYSWVFAKKVKGQVVDVQRVTAPTAIIGGRVTDAQMYSYSVLIKGDDNILYSASSEDRQWQVVKPGYCIDALLYRYPPWTFDKAGSFFNVRVEQIRICPGQTALPDSGVPQSDPVVPPTPAPEPPTTIK